MRIRGHERADQRGFTLAELLVVVAIIGLVMTGVLTLLMTGNESYLTGSNQVEAQAAVRAAIERVTQDIREAGYGPLSDGVCAPPLPAGCFDAVLNPTQTSFTLQNDWNGSGAIQPAIQVPVSYNIGGVTTLVNRGEQITYSVVGGNLQRQESADPAGLQVLVTSVQQANIGGAVQPFFQYLDASGTILANPGATPWLIRTIWVNMRVGVQNQAAAVWQTGAIQVTMSDRIRLRNRN